MFVIILNYPLSQLVLEVLLVCIHRVWTYSRRIVGLTIIIQHRLVKLNQYASSKSLLSTTLHNLAFVRVIRQQPFYLNLGMTFEKL